MSKLQHLGDVPYLRVRPPLMYEQARALCRQPYAGHPKGCPNWGRRSTCPPAAPALNDVIDTDGLVFCVYNAFALWQHAARKREKHPDWSDRQIYCCLYWQPRARAQLRAKVEKVLGELPGWVAIYCPEACGVNVTATMLQIGIRLEWPPRMVAYQVVLVGAPLERIK